METGDRFQLKREPPLVASFLGSGINGNSLVGHRDNPLSLVASFLGSGINGNKKVSNLRF